MSEWISVNDRLPDADRKVLIFIDPAINHGFRNIRVASYLDTITGQSLWLDEDNCICDVMYWMTIPEPPE